MSYGAPRTIEIAKGVQYTYPVVPCSLHGGIATTSENTNGPFTTAWCPVCELYHAIPIGRPLTHNE